MKYEFKPIGEMFNKYKIINVPYYQRDYVWGTKNSGRNLYKFIDDIFSQYKNNPESDYFIGTLAFCSERTNDVIDGQQRITSVVLILSLLAKLKCSQEVKDKHDAFLMKNGDFIIQESDYLTEELKFNLGIQSNFSYAKYNVHIDKTVEKITFQINQDWSGYNENWYDSLYEYILAHVKFIWLEYTNIGDSLKYFLNINSLSIQLTQSDIFYSILSQSLRISNNSRSIFTIKQKISKLAEYKGLEKDVEGYKAYDQGAKKGIDNIIYMFLNAYYQKDNNIMLLNETGIGKWLSFYRNDVFQGQLKAKDFTENFIQYLDDLDSILKYFTNNSSIGLTHSSSIYTSWIMLQYENYFDLLKMLTELFRVRHNYFDTGNNLYLNGSKNIDVNELQEIAKRLNLTLILNYIRNSNKRLDGFIMNITLNQGNYKRTIQDIKDDMSYDYIFNLNYNDGKALSNLKIKDESRQIKFIFALQESLLNSSLKGEKDFNDYLEDILLSNKFTIEHLYSIKEYKDSNRLSKWREKGMFTDEASFDTERFSFENLSLLDNSNNSSANDEEITEKLNVYKNARKICNSEYELLIMSLVEYSEFYNNPQIASLDLPNRAIKNITLNTWEKSENNRDFNTRLLELAVDNISNKWHVYL